MTWENSLLSVGNDLLGKKAYWSPTDPIIGMISRGDELLISSTELIIAIVSEQSTSVYLLDGHLTHGDVFSGFRDS